MISPSTVWSRASSEQTRSGSGITCWLFSFNLTGAETSEVHVICLHHCYQFGSYKVYYWSFFEDVFAFTKYNHWAICFFRRLLEVLISSCRQHQPRGDDVRPFSRQLVCSAFKWPENQLFLDALDMRNQLMKWCSTSGGAAERRRNVSSPSTNGFSPDQPHTVRHSGCCQYTLRTTCIQNLLRISGLFG